MSNTSHFNNNNNNSSNNNYIPSFYEDIPAVSDQPVIENNDAHMRSFGNPHPHNFTFSYPTQGTAVTSPRAGVQGSTSAMGFLGAPGLGTTWQHSDPTTLPGFVGGGMNPPIFTGMPIRSDPQPSCSSPMKRPKRKAQEYLDDAPFSKVYLCTDQFANLNINPDSTSKRRSSKEVMAEVKDHDRTGWSRFQEVENSIDYDVQEENAKNKEKGVLHISDAISDSIKSTDCILPRNVVDEIAKPCMQVVLWRSPGEMVRDLVKEETHIPLGGCIPSPMEKPSSFSSLSSSSSSPTPPSRSSIHLDNHHHRQQASNFVTARTLSSHSSSSTPPPPPPPPFYQSTSSSLSSSSSSMPQVPVSSPPQPPSFANSSTNGWGWSNNNSFQSSLASPSNNNNNIINNNNNTLMSLGDPSGWDNNLDLDLAGGDYTEEMQL